MTLATYGLNIRMSWQLNVQQHHIVLDAPRNISNNLYEDSLDHHFADTNIVSCHDNIDCSHGTSLKFSSNRGYKMCLSVLKAYLF